MNDEQKALWAQNYRPITVGYELPKEAILLERVQRDMRKGEIDFRLARRNNGAVEVWRTTRGMLDDDGEIGGGDLVDDVCDDAGLGVVAEPCAEPCGVEGELPDAWEYKGPTPLAVLDGGAVPEDDSFI